MVGTFQSLLIKISAATFPGRDEEKKTPSPFSFSLIHFYSFFFSVTFPSPSPSYHVLPQEVALITPFLKYRNLYTPVLAYLWLTGHWAGTYLTVDKVNQLPLQLFDLKLEFSILLHRAAGCNLNIIRGIHYCAACCNLDIIRGIITLLRGLLQSWHYLRHYYTRHKWDNRSTKIGQRIYKIRSTDTIYDNWCSQFK